MYKSKSNSLQRRYAAQESGWLYPALLLGTALLIVMAIAIGYYWGAKTLPQQQLSSFRTSLNHHWSELESTEVSIRADLDALTHRIGLLQAHVTRINALGSKMVALAKLKPGEFDFAELPAMGGAGEGVTGPSYQHDEITAVLEALELELMEKEQQLQYLDEMMLSKNLSDEIKPRGFPVADGWISSSYGYRTDPFNGKRQFHKGMDFAGAKGTAIFAAAGGIVTRAEKHPQYGKLVEIDHRNGYITRYAHSSNLLVKSGDIVKKGDKIAEMGNTGRSTGTHLHFEVLKNGSTINPSLVLEKKRQSS